MKHGLKGGIGVPHFQSINHLLAELLFASAVNVNEIF